MILIVGVLVTARASYFRIPKKADLTSNALSPTRLRWTIQACARADKVPCWFPGFMRYPHAKMNGFRTLLLVPMIACLMGFSPVEIPPEGRRRLTSLSDTILLVKITKVKLSDEKVADGIGYREIQLEGKVLEVIRGEMITKDFRSSRDMWRVVDNEKATAKHGVQTMEFLACGPFKTGIEDCKEGNRYVVISTDYGRLFYEVSKDKDDWRKEVRPRENPFAPSKEPEKK
jgi:hypothetical protein